MPGDLIPSILTGFITFVTSQTGFMLIKGWRDRVTGRAQRQRDEVGRIAGLLTAERGMRLQAEDGLITRHRMLQLAPCVPREDLPPMPAYFRRPGPATGSIPITKENPDD